MKKLIGISVNMLFLFMINSGIGKEQFTDSNYVLEKARMQNGYYAQMTASKETNLFTQEEVKKLHHSEMEWQEPLVKFRSRPPGPVIKIQSPSVRELSAGSTIQTNSPIDLIILFSKNQHPVNMNSLKVIAKKGFFSKSLTDLMKGYIRGNVLEAQGVKVPTGKFKIEVSIADRNGNRTIKTYRLLVRK